MMSCTAIAAWQKRARGQAEGVTRCPLCNVELDFDQPLAPATAEPDLVALETVGNGQPTEAARAVCRACNIARGATTWARGYVQATEVYPWSRRW